MTTKHEQTRLVLVNLDSGENTPDLGKNGKLKFTSTRFYHNNSTNNEEDKSVPYCDLRCLEILNKFLILSLTNSKSLPIFAKMIPDQTQKSQKTPKFVIILIAIAISFSSVGIGYAFADRSKSQVLVQTSNLPPATQTLTANQNSVIVGTYQGLGWIATDKIRFGNITCILDQNGQFVFKTGKYDLSLTKNEALKSNGQFPSLSMEIKGKYTFNENLINITIQQTSYLLLIDEISIGKPETDRVLNEMQKAGIDYSSLTALPKTTQLEFVTSPRGLDLKPTGVSVVRLEYQGRKI